MSAVNMVLIGAGNRGRDAYGRMALANEGKDFQFVAVADPDAGRRQKFARDHGIPEERCFESWRDVVKLPAALAPVALNATLDREHLESSIALMEAGYHLVLEKPMAVSAEQCHTIAAVAEQNNKMVQVCHPLRFSTFYGRVKKLLEEGTIGRVLSISMAENICFWHFAHSYVRGNWRNMAETGPMILTKCCHDMDLATWLADSRAARVSSFGKLELYRSENKPEGAPARCTDGCPVEDTCPYFAPAAYLKPGPVNWPVSVISLDQSLEARRRALEQGPYGRCVYLCDNDSPDEQVVTAEFENGVLFDFTARALSHVPYRSIRILGTKGEINGYFEKCEITVCPLGQGIGNNPEPVVHKIDPIGVGHMGGDEGVMRNFLRCYHEKDNKTITESLEVAVEGHLLAFAAEEARVSGTVINMRDFRRTHAGK